MGAIMNRKQRRRAEAMMRKDQVPTAPPGDRVAFEKVHRASEEDRDAAIERLQMFADEGCLKCKGTGKLELNGQRAPCSCAIKAAVEARNEHRRKEKEAKDEPTNPV